MVAYSFKKQFVAPILARTKQQTIRADRKRHARDGEKLQLYTAMRTKHCRLIGVAVCESAWPVILDFEQNCIVYLGERLTGWGRLDPFAIRDGFDGWLSLREFWRVNHPDVSVFSGTLILWTQFEGVTKHE